MVRGMTTPLVTVGRIVHFHLSLGDAPRAAIVTDVAEDGSVNLSVFPHNKSDAVHGPFDRVAHSIVPGARVWCWPPSAPRVPSSSDTKRDELPEAPQVRVMKPTRTPEGVAVGAVVVDPPFAGGKK